MPTKRCTCCGESKPLDEFYSHRTNRDGLQSRCKDCARAAGRDYQRNIKAATGQWAAKARQLATRAKWAAIAAENAASTN
jgi:nitrate/TMAO reductase-like tetraheme cytochrome c subunit